ncbi:hypothetical protein [Salinibaculum rarum]|uniref:hypothetical protein n=1 Tax=Salinibaculum rarum TaxID=3058903 RepID=UPI00265EE9B3|nr:hypothetical protein [Salinibaculum sp. KK48]
MTPSDQPRQESERAHAEPDIPQRPPLEIVKQGHVWVVEAYRRGTRKGKTFSTHDSQIDAVRAAKTKMDENRHPCALRWESANSVRNLYWNPLFECLEVRYDELLEGWTIVPERGTCALAVCSSREEACKQAKQSQHDYDFRYLHAYDATGREFEEREHRFLQYDITASGVTFDPTAIEQPAVPDDPAEEPDETDGETGDDTETYVGPASPGQLGASIPDVTEVQFVDTDGILHRYATPWGDGTDAEILAVSRKHVDVPDVRESFEARLSQWRSADHHPSVATVHESGTDPAQWAAYQAGDHTLAATGTDFPVETRLSILGQVIDAVDAVDAASTAPVCGIHPERIHVQSGGTERDWYATVADWGIEWAVQRAVDAEQTDHVTPFTAPEQVDGRLTATTAVYQVGALAYWLLCESSPVPDDTATARAVREGAVPPAQPVSSAPRGAAVAIDRALEANPNDRYRSVASFRRDLPGAL